MTRSILLVAGWLLSVVGLYAAVLILELYWNFFDWQPELNLKTWGSLAAMFCALVAMRFLAWATRDRISQGVSLVLCLSHLALGIYVFPAEPITQGLFARERPSPLWYRAGRFFVLAGPAAFWILALRRRRKTAAQRNCAAM